MTSAGPVRRRWYGTVKGRHQCITTLRLLQNTTTSDIHRLITQYDGQYLYDFCGPCEAQVIRDGRGQEVFVVVHFSGEIYIGCLRE